VGQRQPDAAAGFGIHGRRFVVSRVQGWHICSRILWQSVLFNPANMSGEKKCRLWRLKMSPDGSEACQSFAGITESFEFEASPFHETEKQAAHAAIGSV